MGPRLPAYRQGHSGYHKPLVRQGGRWIAVVAAMALVPAGACARAGGRWEGPRRVAIVEPGRQGSEVQSISVALGPTGEAAAAWVSFADDFGIAAVRGRPDGSWTEPEPLGRGQHPRVAIDSDGRALLVWESAEREDAGALVFSQSSSTSGWSPRRRVPGVGLRAGESDMATDAQGHVLLLAHANVPARSPTLWAQPFTGDTGWGPPEPLPTEGTVAEFPALALNEVGQAVAIWIDDRPGAVVSVLRLLGSRRTVAGAWTAAQEVARPGKAFSFAPPGLAVNGNAIVAWSDQTSSGAGRFLAVRRSPPDGTWRVPEILKEAGFRVEGLRMGFDGQVLIWLFADGGLWSAVYVPGPGWRPIEWMGESLPPAYDGAMAPNGAAHLVWDGLAGPHGVWARRFERSTGWSVAEALDREHPQDSCPGRSVRRDVGRPHVAARADGGAVALWSETECGVAAVWANRFLSE